MGNYNAHCSALDVFPQIASYECVTPFSGGASGAFHFILEKESSKFFLKIFKNEAPRKAILDELSSIGYSCPQCLSEYISSGKTCRVYEYINGINLGVINSKNFGWISLQIVKNLRLLESIDIKKLSCIPEIGIMQKLEECLTDIDDFFGCFSSPFPYSSDYFKQKAKEYAESFNGIELCLIHGDVKIDNFILRNEKLYVLDDGDLSISPFAFNFQYSVHQLYFQDEKSGQLIKTIINQYFQGNIPKWFHNNLKFLLIKKFFNRYKDKAIEKKAEFIVLFKHIFRDIFSNEYISGLS